MLYSWGSIVDPGPRNGCGKVPSPFGMKVYWLDIDYLMLWSNLHDITSKSIGNPKDCRANQDPMDQRGNTQYI